MHFLIEEATTVQTPEILARKLHRDSGLVLLRSASFDSKQARYSIVAARPFLILRASGSQCHIQSGEASRVHFGNPWHLLDSLMSRYELLEELDLPFPLGGCFGYWGYDLKNFVEPKLRRHAINDLELPDCHVGFYDSLVVFDHALQKTWIVSTGLGADGSRTERRARKQLGFWQKSLSGPREGRASCPQRAAYPSSLGKDVGTSASKALERPFSGMLGTTRPNLDGDAQQPSLTSNLSRSDFIHRVQRAQSYIRSGDIYQVNLSHRLSALAPCSPWEFFQCLSSVSPAPFSAFIDCRDFAVASSSPEQFLRMSGAHIQTRPIKGTRPRSADPTRDAQLTYELQTSPKEMAELVMITDLLRNDLGKVCEFGSVQVPELVRLERYPQVQHLVSTVEGRLCRGTTHFNAFASCFPGGSVTGAPKFRAMEIIDELEPVTRGPYTGAIGYLGFNRESQLSVTIRTAICKGNHAYFHVGAGIVADSIPEAEYDETLAKGRGFMDAFRIEHEAPASHYSPRREGEGEEAAF